VFVSPRPPKEKPVAKSSSDLEVQKTPENSAQQTSIEIQVNYKKANKNFKRIYPLFSAFNIFLLQINILPILEPYLRTLTENDRGHN
jgi:hypothetical protein